MTGNRQEDFAREHEHNEVYGEELKKAETVTMLESAVRMILFASPTPEVAHRVADQIHQAAEARAADLADHNETKTLRGRMKTTAAARLN